jgi:hypothetical protein
VGSVRIGIYLNDETIFFKTEKILNDEKDFYKMISSGLSTNPALAKFTLFDGQDKI